MKLTQHAPDLVRLDPVDLRDIERVTTRPIFDELRKELLDSDSEEDQTFKNRAVVPRLRRHRKYHHLALLSAVGAVILLMVGGLVVFGGGSGGFARRVTTSWHRAHRFAAPGKAPADKAGSWRLLDEPLSGTWRQNTAGPPPGSLDCPSSLICYVMSGRYPSPSVGAPLVSESLYVSTDLGSSWSVLPLPSGFAPTTTLSCGGPSDCAAGGIYKGQPVLVTTSDGGHVFLIEPLPSGVGTLYGLSCPTSQFCGGLAATTAQGLHATRPVPYGSPGMPINATFLSMTDGVSKFTDSPIEPGDSMEEIVCSTQLDCTVVGQSDASAMVDPTAGVVAVTTDGGRSWSRGSLPAGFGVDGYSSLSCADALNCSVTGYIELSITNPPQCATLHFPSLQGRVHGAKAPVFSPNPSRAVQAISKVESRLASQAALLEANAAEGVSCMGTGPSAKTTGSDIATTTDGGLTWVPDRLPTNVPQPVFSGLTCPTGTECWASGTEAVYQKIGAAGDAGSSMLLGTTDGGEDWSKVTFTVPRVTPNYDGQSYLGIGSISCPTAHVCGAVGGAAQGSPTAPVYMMVVPSGG